MKKKLEYRKEDYTKKQEMIYIILYSFLIIGLVLLNFLALHSYHKEGIETVVPMDSMLFMLMGSIFLGISCFTAIQLTQYQIGRMFAIYAFLIGVAVILAPCEQLQNPIITMIRVGCTYGSSLLLFQVIGYMCLLNKKVLFRLLRVTLGAVVAIGILAHVLKLCRTNMFWIYILATESVNGSIIFSAICSLIVMVAYFGRSNKYTKLQYQILIGGLSAGVILFGLTQFLPSIYVVQNKESDIETLVELALVPIETVANEIPLLLFAGISIAIIFMLLHREFVLKDTRWKLRYFMIVPCYLWLLNVLLFTYGKCEIWLLLILNGLFLVPCLILARQLVLPETSIQEQTYQGRLAEELEKEKQELSSYLHDEVLQLLIAFYRQVQADESGRYEAMKQPLSKVITDMRRVSHNLYPTMVEDLGLEQSLYVFVEELQTSYPMVKVNCIYQMTEGILPKMLALTCYRAIKELATNAAKHAEGTQIDIVMQEQEEGYNIQVSDNGKGFPLPKDEELLHAPHMGLYTVKRRIAQLQGQIRFSSDSQVGTIYEIYIPKKGVKEINA